MNDKTPANQPFILYTTVNGDVKLNVYLQDETIWLTQKLMAELFRVDVRTVSEHLKNIFAGDELIENSVVRKFRITAADTETLLRLIQSTPLGENPAPLFSPCIYS